MVSDEPFFKDIAPSDTNRKQNVRILAVEFISKNSPISFSQFIKHFQLKRTTGFDIIRDLEISRIITTYFSVDDKGRACKILKIREDQKNGK